MNGRKTFRAFVPLLLNGRLVQWYYATGETKIRLEVPVRHYPEGGGTWRAKRIIIEFVQRSRTHQPYKTQKDESQERVIEWYYTCDNPKITFENETIPRIVE